MTKTTPDKLLIGAHTSAAGGVHKALLQGKELGATTIQLFTSNQKRWTGKAIDDEELARWEKALDETGIQKVMSHDSYLINLGSPNPELIDKSINAFKQEIARCQRLKLAYMNFHPGAATTDTEENALSSIVKSLLDCEAEVAEGNVRLLLEATAGQGTSIGHRFEQLGYILERTHKKIPIGVCIDTCHIFAAGYDIRNMAAWEKTLAEFDKHIGLKHLYALHVNDSKHDIGSRKDRHASLGEGKIGIEGFKAMMQHPKLRELPKYLETPDGETKWKGEIEKLREFA